MTTAKEILELIERVEPGDREAERRIDFAVSDYIGAPRQLFCISRDALKAIRPEGLFVEIAGATKGGFYCMAQSAKDDECFFSPFEEGLTEELAELHAIIQAIAHERGEE